MSLMVRGMSVVVQICRALHFQLLSMRTAEINLD